MSTSLFDSPTPASSASSDEGEKSVSTDIFAIDPKYAHLPSSVAFLPPLKEWDYKEPVSDVELHPRIIDMLSQSSNLFEDLWPTIIELATPQQRLDSFATVNRFFAGLYGNVLGLQLMRNLQEYTINSRRLSWPERRYPPIILDEPPVFIEWRTWGAAKCGFRGLKYFKKFCALGDIDPKSGIRWAPYDPVPCDPKASIHISKWIWASRDRDLVFEMKNNPMEEGKNDSYADDLYGGHLGVTGSKDKAEKMYTFFAERRGRGIYYDGIARERNWM